MECYNELLPPTAVSHAVALPFQGPNANNLVIAKTSLLQVFRIISSDAKDGAAKNKDRLVLVGEYPLSGTVTAISRVKILETKTGGEALLLSFAQAKLSLIEWDAENNRTSTISIHYYEGDNVIEQPFGPGLAECDTILTVDPSSRCAAFKFGARSLAIIPFKQPGDDLIGDEEEGNDMAVTSNGKDNAAQNGEELAIETPYKPSFVLPLTTLDPSLSNVVHLTFLHEYREPTFGILASPTKASSALFMERKDILTYTVFTLDLEQRASTNLITVSKLPSSLWKVLSLPLPIGGALLIGTNEFIHIDQSGKANATAVNEFAKLESDFGMADQSYLNMKLEGCVIETLDFPSGVLLIALADGSLATLTFKVLRRSISELVVTRITSESVSAVSATSPSCLAGLADGNVFIGSSDGASVLVNFSPPSTSTNRKRNLAQMSSKSTEPEDEDEIEEDDDDLYSAAPEPKRRATSALVASEDEDLSDYKLEFQDHLPSIGPTNQICLGKAKHSRSDKLELLAGTGRGQASRLAILNRDITPTLVHTASIDGVTGAWAVLAKANPNATTEVAAEESRFDNLLFVTDGASTRIYDVDGSETGYIERSAPEFETEGESLEVSTLRDGTRVVQFRRNEIRVYEADLSLSQIIPMVDEETDAEFNIIHKSTCDPYILVIRDDSSVQVLQVQGQEIAPLDAAGSIAEKKWLSGSLYSGNLTRNEPVLLLLTVDGALHGFSLPALEPIFVATSLPHLSPVFSLDSAQRRMGAKDTLTELSFTDLGSDDIVQPYLILRTAMDDIVLYEPFSSPAPSASEPWYAGLRFRKVPSAYIPKYNEAIADELELRPVSLTPVSIGGYQAVCIPGMPPAVIIKDATSLPKALEIRQKEDSGKVQVISPLHRESCKRGFLTIGPGGTLQEFTLPEEAWYGAGWSVTQLDLGDLTQEVRQLTYHAPRGLYVVATCRDVDFYFSEDDNRHPDQDGKFFSSVYYRLSQRITTSITSSSYNSGVASTGECKMNFLPSAECRLCYIQRADCCREDTIPITHSMFGWQYHLLTVLQISPFDRKSHNTVSISYPRPLVASSIHMRCHTSNVSLRSRSCRLRSLKTPTSKGTWSSLGRQLFEAKICPLKVR